MFSISDLWMVAEVRSSPNYVSHALCPRIFVVRLFIIRVSFRPDAFLALISFVRLSAFASALVYCRFEPIPCSTTTRKMGVSR